MIMYSFNQVDVKDEDFVEIENQIFTEKNKNLDLNNIIRNQEHQFNNIAHNIEKYQEMAKKLINNVIKNQSNWLIYIREFFLNSNFYKNNDQILLMLKND